MLNMCNNNIAASLLATDISGMIVYSELQHVIVAKPYDLESLLDTYL